MVPCKSTAEEVSFEWSHHWISSTDSKVITSLHVSMIGSESGRFKETPSGRDEEKCPLNGDFADTVNN